MVAEGSVSAQIALCATSIPADLAGRIFENRGCTASCRGCRQTRAAPKARAILCKHPSLTRRGPRRDGSSRSRRRRSWLKRTKSCQHAHPRGRDYPGKPDSSQADGSAQPRRRDRKGFGGRVAAPRKDPANPLAFVVFPSRPSTYVAWPRFRSAAQGTLLAVHSVWTSLSTGSAIDLQLAGGLSPMNFEPSGIVQRTRAEAVCARPSERARAMVPRIGFSFSGTSTTPRHDSRV